MARIVISGAFAGAVSAFVFAIIHAVFISDIWFSAPAMMVTGALCGAVVFLALAGRTFRYATVNGPALGS